MIITVDKAGNKAIFELLDVALKVNGIQNLQGANEILSSIKILPEEEKEEEEKNKKIEVKEKIQAEEKIGERKKRLNNIF